jgi:asparagine synthase (glutamine-hydrolysing)
MCGITGIFDRLGRRDFDRSLLSAMNESQHHRGPDAGGLHFEPGVALGHRRLSIIDLASGQQPLFSADRTLAVIFNGEIYNFQSLRRELEAAGHRFQTHSDTEVIIHGWQAWGTDCVRRFRGMFAFALWDRNTETLFLARDRLGKKPLFYASLPDGQFIFGSELKALLAHPALPRDLEPRAVEDYFAYGYVPDPKTIFRHALKLPPATTLTLRRGQALPEPRPYWDIAFTPIGMGEADAAVELIERLQEAVRLRLISEVPLGAFLSGGVDSSAVVSLMAGLMNEPVNTCSIAFSDPAYDEANYAEQVARQYHTNHKIEMVNASDFDLIDTLVDVYDEPYADSSAMPTYRVCELARKHVTVALSGDGGDETFAGYRRYRWHNYEEQIRAVLPAALRRPVFGTLGLVYPKLDWAPKVLRAKSTLQALARNSVEGYFHAVSVMPDELRHRLFSTKWRRDLQAYEAIEVLREHASRSPAQHPLSLIQYLDFKTYLPGDILTKVDRASMAHGLEVRAPILDHEFVDWVSGLPPTLKLRSGEGKYIFKRALESRLPRNILYRSKMGFGVPLASWFRGPLRERVRAAVLGDTLQQTGIFDHKFLRRLVDDHQAGVRDYSAPLWALLMFEGFARICLGARARAA